MKRSKKGRQESAEDLGVGRIEKERRTWALKRASKGKRERGGPGRWKGRDSSTDDGEMTWGTGRR